MELIRKIKHRIGYVWWWRAKHWWLDTPQGAVARILALVMVAVAGAVQGVRAAVAAATPHDPAQPQQAIIWIVVWLVVALLVGVAVALSMGNKAADPADVANKGPTTQDGQSVKRHYGEVWIDDPGMAAWRVVGRDPIKASGGK